MRTGEAVDHHIHLLEIKAKRYLLDYNSTETFKILLTKHLIEQVQFYKC